MINFQIELHVTVMHGKTIRIYRLEQCFSP